MIITIKNGVISTSSANTKQYNGEKFAGDLNKWEYFGTDPNDILLLTYDVLSQRATTLYHTHAPVSSAVNKLTQYSIGSGLIFRSQPDWEILGISKEYAKDWGSRFQKLINYFFKLTNYYEKQSVLFRTGLILGDSLLFFDRNVDNNDPFDLVETGGDYINFQGVSKDGKEKTTLGIIHDNALRRKGAILTDGKQVYFQDGNKDQNFVQFYNKQMARQLRGFPLSYKIIAACKNNDRLWDATLSRAVMETMIFGVSNEETSDSTFYDQSEKLAEIARSENGNADTENTISRIAGVSEQTPGAVYSYKGKGGIKFTDIKTPSNNFDKMQSAFIDMVGMATDVPPEVILSKYSTSYTAHKGAFNDFIKSFMLYRNKFINGVNNIVVLEAAKWLFLNELIEMPVTTFFDNRIVQLATTAGNWLGPVPGHINPAQEVAAKQTEVENAFKLRSDVALEYGNEFDNMIEEWQQEEKEFSKKSESEKAEIIQEEIIDNDDKKEDDEE